MSPEDSFDAFKGQVREGVENALARYFSEYPDTQVTQAARYAVLDGGHRWRAIATIAAGLIFDGDAFEICMPAACGVELAHAASLVLDDAPSMDDALVRRGRPCTHLAFPSWAADMAPAFMVNMAYDIILRNPRASDERRVKTAVEFGRAGVHMAHGQEIDVAEPSEDHNEEALLRRYRLKSGSLYAAAMRVGAILAGASDDEADSLYACGMDLGLSYQFLDDIADVVAGVDEVGKESGMDAGKCTATDLFGVDGARSRADELEQEALSRIEQYGPEADLLRSLVSHASWAAT
jgi:geranylgeranyl pyrophosphate synthase